VMSIYAPNIVSFDIGAPLLYAGAEGKRKEWEGAFAAYTSPITYEVRDLNVTTEISPSFIASTTSRARWLAVTRPSCGWAGLRASAASMASGGLCIHYLRVYM